MPVVAIASIAMGASAIAAGGLTILQTIAAIGSIVSGVGALTGNKTLMKVGAVASLAGGIGAFAQSQGWMGATSAAEAAASATQTSAIDAMQAAPSGAEYSAAADVATTSPVSSGSAVGQELGTLDMAEAATQTTGGLNTTQSITDTISQASPEATKAMGAGSGLMDAASPADAPLAGGLQESPQSLIKADLTGTPTSGVDAMGGDLPKITNPADARLAAGTQATPMDGGTGTSNKILEAFSGFFRNKDGTMNKDMLSMAGQFIGGAFDEKKKAETDFLNARAETERTQLENASAVPGMNFKSQPKPGGVFRPTAPTYRPVRNGGLMNAR